MAGYGNSAWEGLGIGLAQLGGMMSRTDNNEEKWRHQMELQKAKDEASQARNNARLEGMMDRLLMKDTGGSGAGGSGGFETMPAEGTNSYEAAMQRVGDGDRNAGKARWDASLRGDNSPYAQAYSASSGESELDIQGQLTTLSDEGKKLMQAKNRQIAEIREQWATGKNYDQIVKGRREQQKVNATDDVLAGGDAADISQAIAAGEGKPMADLKDHTVFSPYQGDLGDTTDVGKSEIAKNKAMASKYYADAQRAKERGEPVSKEERLGLQAMINAQNKTIENATKGLNKMREDKMYTLAKEGSQQWKEMEAAKNVIKAAEEEKSQLMSTLAASIGVERPGKDDKAKAAPAAVAKPPPAAAPEGDGKTKETAMRPTTQAAMDRVPSGAFYINPADGRVYRKK